MTRAHAVAAIIEDPAGQQSLGPRSYGFMAVDLFVQLGLDRIKQVPIEKGGLFALENLTFEQNVSDKKAMAHQVAERPPWDRNPADGLPSLQRSNFGDDALIAEFSHEPI